MKKIVLYLIPFLLFAYEPKQKVLTEKECKKERIEDPRVDCKCVCDTKDSKEEKIAKAIEFYKQSPHYNFEKKESPF